MAPVSSKTPLLDTVSDLRKVTAELGETSEEHGTFCDKEEPGAVGASGRPTQSCVGFQKHSEAKTPNLRCEGWKWVLD